MQPPTYEELGLLLMQSMKSKAMNSKLDPSSRPLHELTFACNRDEAVEKQREYKPGMTAHLQCRRTFANQASRQGEAYSVFHHNKQMRRRDWLSPPNQRQT